MAVWTVLLLDAAFILLSGASSEPRRCYWCGPLAEQVHRSRRSAPCNNSDHVTECEPKYEYCAVVATSPHRVESRYCVKVYQDECYPLYCNSTKTWKITCPCRGDLCNGPNTEREERAFALLPGLVAKTHKARIKKRTANAAPHLIKHDGRKKIISNSDAEIHNISNPSSNDVNNMTNANKLIVTENDVMSNIGDNSSQQTENMQSDQPTNIVIEHHNEETSVANQAHIQTTTNELIEIVIHVSEPTEESSRMKGNEQPCTELPTTTLAQEAHEVTEPVKNEVAPTATTAQSVSNNAPSMKPTETNIVVQSEATKITDAVQQDVIEIKPTNKPHSEPPTTVTEVMPNDQPMIPEEQMQNDAPAISPTESVQEMKTTETVTILQSPTKDIVKASEIPTAEALQQNGSPVTAASVPITEKPTEPTTTDATTTPTIMTTRGQITTTTPVSKRKNNAAVRITFTSALLLICIAYL